MNFQQELSLNLHSFSWSVNAYLRAACVGGIVLGVAKESVGKPRPPEAKSSEEREGRFQGRIPWQGVLFTYCCFKLRALK